MASELRKIAEGRDAEIFEWEQGTVLRLMREPDTADEIAAEVLALQALRDAGVSVPAPHEQITVRGRPGLVMDRIDGPDLLTVIARQPWKVYSVGMATGRVHAEMHAVRAPRELPSLKESLAERLESDRIPDDARDYAREVLAELGEGDRVCHGDFHPGNLLVQGSTYFVIDWTGAARGDPAADCARTRMMFALGALAPGSPLRLRLLAGFGRQVLVAAYRKGYRARRVIDDPLVRRWQIPVAAARLVDDIAEERPGLLKMLQGRLRERG